MSDMYNGKFKQSLEIITNKIERMTFGQEKYVMQLFLGYCLNKAGDYQDAFNLLSSLIKQASSKECRFFSHILAIEAALRVGNLDYAEQTYKDLQHFDENYLEQDEQQFYLLKTKAFVYWFRGNMKESLRFALQALDLRENVDDLDTHSFLLNLIGIIKLRTGYLQEAQEYLERILVVNHLDKQTNAIAMVNLGAIHLQKGELEKSLKQYLPGTQIFFEIGNLRHYADTQKSVGQIYFRKGMLKEAQNHLNISLKYKKKVNNSVETTDTLLWLCVLHADKREANLVEQYLGEIGAIKDQIDHRLVNLRYKVAKSLYYKLSSRVRDYGRGIDLLEEVINAELIDHELATLALLTSIELLLLEINISSEEETLNEISEKASQLQEIANNINSYYLMVESYWLQAELALFKLDIETAKELLSKGQDMAEMYGLEKLAIKLSLEYDQLLDKEDKIVDLVDAPLSDRVVQFAPVIEQIIQMKKEFEDLTPAEEIPIRLMLIIPESGITFYSYSWTKGELEMNEYLMGAFLRAIREFTGELFHRSLDRIKIEEFTLLVSLNHDLNYMVCYIYKGQSYASQQKIKAVSEQINLNPDIKDIINKVKTTGSLNEHAMEAMLTPVVMDIFN
ncbi:MAG: tetratricopeptide repeat protein [Candidatus Heimdallarchaeota archaeon]|nr:tetratricopeptide repeat protein [Candidatus Heimdallarchaeota archaeon]